MLKDEEYGLLQFFAGASREENKLFFPIFIAEYSRVLTNSSQRVKTLNRWLPGLTIMLGVFTAIIVFSGFSDKKR